MKVSYTILSAWWKGDKDRALAMINNKEIEYPIKIHEAFGYGKGAHKAWQEETKVTGNFPAIFKIDNSFRVIATELKLRKQINEEDWLSGIIDVVAVGEINEQEIIVMADYKTGAKADRWQSAVYHYLIQNNKWWEENIKVQPKQFWYLSMDKADGTTSTEIIQLTVPERPEDYDTPDATTLTMGENFVQTVLDDMKNELNL